MNKLERLVYNCVRDHPQLKRAIRDVYQKLSDAIPPPQAVSDLCITNRLGYFFGFHDKTPFSSGDRYLAAHRVSHPLRMPTSHDLLGFGFFSGENWRQFHHVGETRAWNWHQGAMLQWLGEEEFLLVNDWDGARHIAKIYNVSGALHRVIKCPLAAVSRDGLYGASYDFVRSNRGMPGYGYYNGSDPEHDRLLPKEAGLDIVDVSTGRAERVVRIARLASEFYHSSMEGAFHWITHCQFSPNGRRLKFFHRWINEKTRQLWTRMFSCGLGGDGLHLFPTVRMVSHVGWRDDDWVCAYARTLDYDDGYFLFRDRSNEIIPVGPNIFTSDGHPSFTMDGEWMITDSYPDRRRRQRLYIYNVTTGVSRLLGTFWLPPKFIGKSFKDHWTVDLHPRLSRTGGHICFDNGFAGERAMATAPLEF